SAVGARSIEERAETVGAREQIKVALHQGGVPQRLERLVIHGQGVGSRATADCQLGAGLQEKGIAGRKRPLVAREEGFGVRRAAAVDEEAKPSLVGLRFPGKSGNPRSIFTL